MTKSETDINQVYIELRNIQRYLDFPLKIESVAYLPNNFHIHRNNRLSSLFLSFILYQEEKEYVAKHDGEVKVAAHFPRMGVLYPGVRLDTVKPSRLEELFFTYDAGDRGEFDRLGIRRCEFSLTKNFNAILQRVKNTIHEIQRPGAADRLDQLAIELATEAMISAIEQKSEKAQSPDERIFRIANHFRFNFRNKIDVNSLVAEYGMTPRTFYREWKKYYTVPPAQYLIELRLKRACDMLLLPNIKIYEIADACGFCDPMYFDRCFRKRYHLSPKAYRAEFLEPNNKPRGGGNGENE